MANETQYYGPLRELIEQGGFQEAIRGLEPVRDVLDLFEGPHAVASPSIDSFARRRCARAALDAYEALGSLRVIAHLHDDISAQTGEIMYPDFLLYNSARHVLIIVEVKDSAGASRETLTETYAYDHEVKTRLPFLASASIVHVIVSSHWPTLLCHAVTGAATWDNKTILCVRPEVANGELTLRVFLPAQWEQFFGGQLPPLSLVTRPIAVDPIVKLNAEAFSVELSNILNTVVIDGRKLGSHGFALLSMYSKLNGVDLDVVNVIWVCVLNPFAFIAGDDDTFTRRLRDGMAADPPDAKASIDVIVERLKRRFSGFSLRVGKSADWPVVRWQQLQASYRPYNVVTWGLFEDLAVDAMFLPGSQLVREVDPPGVPLTIQSPEIVIPVLDVFCGTLPLAGGVLSTHALYNFGAHLSIMRDWSRFGATDHIPFCEWTRLLLLSEVRELNHLVLAQVNADAAIVDLTLPAGASQFEPYVDRVAAWCSNALLKDEPVLRAMFELGMSVGLAVLFDSFGDRIFEERRPAIAERLAAAINELKGRGIWQRAYDALRLEHAASNVDADESFMARILDGCGDQRETVAVADSLAVATLTRVPPLPWRLAVMNDHRVDVDGLRENLLRVRRGGSKTVMGIIRNPNAGLWVGEIPGGEAFEIDLAKEVLCMDLSGAPYEPCEVPWEDVRVGHWPVPIPPDEA